MTVRDWQRALLVGIAVAALRGFMMVAAADPQTYQVVVLRRGPAWSADATPAAEALRQQHLDHLRRMGASGRVLMAGPLDDQDAAAVERMFYFYRAASPAEARALAEQDPMVRAGQLRVEVAPWQEARFGAPSPAAPGVDARGGAARGRTSGSDQG